MRSHYQTAKQIQHEDAREKREDEARAWINRARVADKAKRILHV